MGTHSLKVPWVPVHSDSYSAKSGLLFRAWWPLLICCSGDRLMRINWFIWGHQSWLPLPKKQYFPSSDSTNCKPLKMALPKQWDLLSELLVILIWEGRDSHCTSFFISAAPCSLERGLWDTRWRQLPNTFLQGEQRVEQFVSEGLSLHSPNNGLVFKSCLFLTGHN